MRTRAGAQAGAGSGRAGGGRSAGAAAGRDGDRGRALVRFGDRVRDLPRTGPAAAITATRDGEYLGTAEAGFTNQPEAVYQRLRGRNADLDQVTARVIPLPPPLTPRRVGRDRFHDVVLSPTSSTRRTQLRADINHPILFDHPVDHAPGMLLLEAVRQAAYCSAFPRRGVLTAMERRFFRYAELNSPCWIETTPAADGTTATGTHPVRVLARQNGEDVFTATATITTTAPAPLRVFATP
ncbi:AfsA-related hotdog domain-containing protein [Streptomyces sp. NPDC020858]|uniref:AfsA-related hotdog domain-containing protein n=1 Tax=Streptomyces sp. NPDC020858 TaxID=3365097 RepID=UPI0037B28537